MSSDSSVRIFCLAAGEGSLVHRYDEPIKALTDRQTETNGKQPGDPNQAVERVLDVVRREGSVADAKEIPLRVTLGRDASQVVRNQCLETLKEMDEFDGLTRSTDFPDAGSAREYK